MGHVGSFDGVVVLGQSFQERIFGTGGTEILLELRVTVGTGDAGCGTEIACRDVALPVGAHDIAVLAELEATAQDSVLQGGPHLGKGQSRSPAARRMSRRV